MKTTIFACAAAVALCSAASNVNSAPVPDRAPGIIPATTSSADSTPAVPRDWVEGYAGKTLTAIDGSTLSLSLTEDGFTRHLVSAGGDKQDSGFTFINKNLGTVSEDSTVVGFFRRVGSGLEITFEDGRTETITATDGGGVSMVLHAPDSGMHCMAWYPDGHVFNDSEKRLALALYAKKLGLSSPVQANTAAIDSCAPASSTAAAQPASLTSPMTSPDGPPASNAAFAPKAPAAPISPSKHNRKRTAALDQQGTAPGTLAPLVDVAVRDSQVHAIDETPVSTPASFDPDHGASTCLSVDSDGNHLGFRNHCRFDVEFAYCLKDTVIDVASCDKGPETGLVAANSFTPLLRSTALGGNDVERHFRWVGCALVDGALEARLDQTNPPAGRCIAPSAS
jgi:hypothetical protein